MPLHCSWDSLAPLSSWKSDTDALLCRGRLWNTHYRQYRIDWNRCSKPDGWAGYRNWVLSRFCIGFYDCHSCFHPWNSTRDDHFNHYETSGLRPGKNMGALAIDLGLPRWVFCYPIDTRLRVWPINWFYCWYFLYIESRDMIPKNIANSTSVSFFDPVGCSYDDIEHTNESASV